MDRVWFNLHGATSSGAVGRPDVPRKCVVCEADMITRVMHCAMYLTMGPFGLRSVLCDSTRIPPQPALSSQVCHCNDQTSPYLCMSM